ncbi:MAG: hypothetical protein ACPL7R_08350, partial [Anaerolineae bacterium]
TVRRVRHLVLFGEAAGLIHNAVSEAMRRAEGQTTLAGVHVVRRLEEAVPLAADLAQPGDVVLLAPGGTSFDAFRDFAERGQRFKELVRSLQSQTDGAD